MTEPIKNRYEFVVLFDVENGNPNGDPDAGNMPRIDVDGGFGIVTDVCIKRKIRNYVQIVKEDEPGFDIYISEGEILNDKDEKGIQAVCEQLGIDRKDINKAKKNSNIDVLTRDIMCATYFDVRTFGAVMTTFVKEGLNSGQVRGPVQLAFARSIDPIIPQEVTITRVVKTSDARAEKAGTAEMGHKYVVPYGLYRLDGYVSANLARKTTGFSEDDLELLWEAIINMFEHDHSAARGKMAVRALIVFKHASELGNAPAHRLFDAVTIQKLPGVAAPRSINDYGKVFVDMSQIPDSIEVQVKEGASIVDMTGIDA